jgi:hypothetical protein
VVEQHELEFVADTIVGGTLMSTIATVKSAPGGGQLSNFHETPVLRLLLGHGNYVVWGRMTVLNFDGSPQWVHARLVHAGKDIDLLFQLKLGGFQGGADKIAIPLQAWITITSETREAIEMRCASYKASWSEASLMALSVDQIEVSP